AAGRGTDGTHAARRRSSLRCKATGARPRAAGGGPPALHWPVIHSRPESRLEHDPGKLQTFRKRSCFDNKGLDPDGDSRKSHLGLGSIDIQDSVLWRSVIHGFPGSLIWRPVMSKPKRYELTP